MIVVPAMENAPAESSAGAGELFHIFVMLFGRS